MIALAVVPSRPMTSERKRTGAEELRAIVETMNGTNEGFNDRFTAEELVQIFRMMFASEWDLYPDTWAPRQVAEALQGRIPTWNDEEEPTYDVCAKCNDEFGPHEPGEPCTRTPVTAVSEGVEGPETD